MNNGCICCTLRDDLLQEVARLAQTGRFDYLLIESTGISEPLPVAATFTFELPGGTSLSEVARLDTMVTVVDGETFLHDYLSAQTLKERDLATGEEDRRTIVDLLIEQVEFANVLIINRAHPEDVAPLYRLYPPQPPPRRPSHRKPRRTRRGASGLPPRPSPPCALLMFGYNHTYMARRSDHAGAGT